jgi:hypothetical protein
MRHATRLTRLTMPSASRCAAPQAVADALPLPPDVQACLATVLGATTRPQAAAELAPAAPLSEEDASQVDPWRLMEDGCACALAGAVRVKRR